MRANDRIGMKSRNVNKTKLQRNTIPKLDTCPCELCDDGCFDLEDYTHHANCQRQLSQRTTSCFNKACPLKHHRTACITSAADPSKQIQHHCCSSQTDNNRLISLGNQSIALAGFQRDHYRTSSVKTIENSSNDSIKQV
jgi:hypothetical protein